MDLYIKRQPWKQSSYRNFQWFTCLYIWNNVLFGNKFLTCEGFNWTNWQNRDERKQYKCYKLIKSGKKCYDVFFVEVISASSWFWNTSFLCPIPFYKNTSLVTRTTRHTKFVNNITLFFFNLPSIFNSNQKNFEISLLRPMNAHESEVKFVPYKSPPILIHNNRNKCLGYKSSLKQLLMLWFVFNSISATKIFHLSNTKIKFYIDVKYVREQSWRKIYRLNFQYFKAVFPRLARFHLLQFRNS